jgi:hypothetical protein
LDNDPHQFIRTLSLAIHSSSASLYILYSYSANMKLSVALSMGLALLPEMASAAGGFYQSCKNTVCPC